MILAGDGSRENGYMQESQIKRLFCKPICKPDAAKRGETGETESANRGLIYRPLRWDTRAEIA
jgi:hypothetical protein